MSTKFRCDYAKRVSACKKCKATIVKDTLRLAKVVPNPFSESTDEMKQYFHLDCLFDTFTRVRPMTKVIESVGDVEGYAQMGEKEKKEIREKIEELEEMREKKKNGGKKSSTPKVQKTVTAAIDESPTKTTVPPVVTVTDKPAKPAGSSDSWFNFCTLCRQIAATPKYTDKSTLIQEYIEDKKFDGDAYLLFKMLLPSVDQRVYNVKGKQLIKHFATIFGEFDDDMTDYFNECGEISDTVSHYFGKSTSSTKPQSRSKLTMQQVDVWLSQLANGSGDDSTVTQLRSIAKQCTTVDLQYIIRQIMSDLRMNCGVKHVMGALAENAYAAFQSCRNLRTVVDKAMKQKAAPKVPGVKKTLSVGITLQQPVLPMLAEACRSVGFAFGRCPKGMLAEIKYDGERVQIHKTADDEFTFYSRSLKPVQPHKVAELKKYIVQAFPEGVSCILDSEVLVVDTTNGKPLPFGTLGKIKKSQMSNAQTCLFVFDILMYDGESLMERKLTERKTILHAKMTAVKHRVHFSDYEHIEKGDKAKLALMIDRAIDEGLEGLVMKDVNGLYEPGKRHWLKVKKDYLDEGLMADSADLLVLGGYYGTGSKGGLLSVFLMGCLDPLTNTYRTVTKCGNGHNDAYLEKFNKEWVKRMTKIGRDADRLPKWIKCARGLTPDFIITDPTDAPVWEIVGAEFSKSDNHTADGVSIRFPRVTKVRDDKDYKTATNLQELVKMANTSKVKQDFTTSATKASALAGKADEEEEATTGLAALLNSGTFHSSPVASAVECEDVPKRSTDAQENKLKRKSEDTDSRPVCKYGAECYQKNAAHKKEFRHPAKKSEKSDDPPVKRTRSAAKAGGSSESSTRDVPPFFRFHNVHYVDDDVEKREKISRFVNFYGGTFVEEGEALKPGHYVCAEEVATIHAYITKCGNVDEKSVVKTKPQWILDCVKQKKLVSGDDYDF